MVAGLAVPQISRTFGWKALFPSLVGLAVLSAVVLVPVTMRLERGQRGFAEPHTQHRRRPRRE
jgi:sugar phosphate permease